ncbi:MAG: hypothetical protein ACLS3C_11005 [Oscillospiraceae bacterium]
MSGRLLADYTYNGGTHISRTLILAAAVISSLCSARISYRAVQPPLGRVAVDNDRDGAWKCRARRLQSTRFSTAGECLAKFLTAEKLTIYTSAMKPYFDAGERGEVRQMLIMRCGRQAGSARRRTRQSRPLARNFRVPSTPLALGLFAIPCYTLAKN